MTPVIMSGSTNYNLPNTPILILLTILFLTFFLIQISIGILKLLSDDFELRKDFIVYLIPIYPFVKQIINKIKGLS